MRLQKRGCRVSTNTRRRQLLNSSTLRLAPCSISCCVVVHKELEVAGEIDLEFC